ncbi:MAG TPA: flavin reductase family protein [bacterium]|nr:flavin reductase family protein [bacterium]
MHKTIQPAILYFGTPVVLVSTLNEDGTANLAPMSSAWWLQDRCLLGFDPTSQSPRNLLHSGQCVLNLPSADQTALVNRLALTTGSDPVPPHKAMRGYRHDGAKFEAAGATPVPGECVAPPRVAECPVQLEAELEQSWSLAPRGQGAQTRAAPLAIQVRIVRVHVDEHILLADEADRIDPDRWRPLIMSFQQFYGLGPRLGESRLASVPEASYRPGRAMDAMRSATR